MTNQYLFSPIDLANSLAIAVSVKVQFDCTIGLDKVLLCYNAIN